MNFRKFNPIAAAVLFSCSPLLAQTTGAESQGTMEGPLAKMGDMQVFGGLRLWAANWDGLLINRIPIADPTSPSVVTIRDVEQRFSSTKIVPIPFLGVRYRNFIASASYFPKTSYDSKGLLTDGARREEFDLTTGYYVLPQLALSVGYKTGKVERISSQIAGGTKIDAILVGASGSVPLEGSERLSLYGNVAYGRGKSRQDFAFSTGETSSNVTYRIGEIGLSYRFFSAPQTFLKQLNLSLGYRAQLFTIKDIPFGTYATPLSTTPVSVDRRDAQSTTDGLVLSLVGVF